MHVIRRTSNRLGLAFLAFFPAGTGAAFATEICFPHCDYEHYYGPLDFSYSQPGLFGYPQQCGPQGDCSPHPAYTTGIPADTTGIPRKRITIRFPRVMGAPLR